MNTTFLEGKIQSILTTKKAALILYVTAGDPSLAVTREFLWYCQKVGVDVVELGVPFSDPLADGPVIQASSFRAVQKSVTLSKILNMLKIERKKGLEIPVVLMSSVTPLIAQGIHSVSKKMSLAGVNGIILPDLPVDEDPEIRRTLSDAGIDCIQMLTPTTDAKRKDGIIQASRGFLYYVAVIGLTGKYGKSAVNLKAQVIQSQKKSKIPVCVGFGISTAAQVKKVSQYAKGVIVGSAVVNDLALNSPKVLSNKSKRFIQSLVRATQ